MEVFDSLITLLGREKVSTQDTVGCFEMLE